MKELVKKYYKPAILILSLIFVFCLVYSVHFDYNYPFHSDEWQHAAQSVGVVDRGYGGFNPYFEGEGERKDLEIGFHVFLAEMFLITGMDPVQDYQWLPALFATIAAFILFVFVNKVSNFPTAIFSMLFFASIKSNVNILGLWFFVPLTLAVLLLYLLFFLFSEGLEKKDLRLLFVSVIILFTLFLVHGISAVFAAPILLLYFLASYFPERKEFNKMFFGRSKKHIFIFGFLIILGLLAFAFVWKGSISHTLGFIKSSLMFGSEWTNYAKLYTFRFYGTIPLVLAMVGILPAIMDARKRLFALWAGFSIVLIFFSFFYTYNVSFLVPYQRAIYYTFIVFAPLSAFGLSYCLGCFKKVFGSKTVFFLLYGLIVLFVFYSVFANYYDTDKGLGLYHNIDDADYDAIKWIEENYGNYNIILAFPHISSAIYPVSRNYVVSITPTQLGGGPLKETYRFFEKDCEFKAEFLEDYKADFVLSKEKIECEGFEEIYRKNNYVYTLESGSSLQSEVI
ncbi:hypothetical protein ACFLZZ_03265 [Nanoarchaeota archaeon]